MMYQEPQSYATGWAGNMGGMSNGNGLGGGGPDDVVALLHQYSQSTGSEAGAFNGGGMWGDWLAFGFDASQTFGSFSESGGLPV